GEEEEGQRGHQREHDGPAREGAHGEILSGENCWGFWTTEGNFGRRYAPRRPRVTWLFPTVFGGIRHRGRACDLGALGYARRVLEVFDSAIRQVGPAAFFVLGLAAL